MWKTQSVFPKGKHREKRKIKDHLAAQPLNLLPGSGLIGRSRASGAIVCGTIIYPAYKCKNHGPGLDRGYGFSQFFSINSIISRACFRRFSPFPAGTERNATSQSGNSRR